MRIASLALVSGIVLGGPLAAQSATAPSVPRDPLAAAVMQADLDFGKAAAARGLDGWMSWFAADAVTSPFFKAGFIRGLDSIRTADANLFADTTMSLRWWPTDGGAWKDRKHGYTKGRYEMVKRAADGSTSVVGTGSYLTVWRKERGGWKVLLDTGAPDPK